MCGTLPGVQSWANLQRDLLANGYRSAAFLAFTCPAGHGRFRTGVAQPTPRISCPRCGLACKPTYLAQGLTQRPLPVVEAQSAEMRPPPAGSHKLKYISRVSRRAFEKAKTRSRLSRFEQQVRKLKLDNEQSMAKSKQLRTWAVRPPASRLRAGKFVARMGPAAP